MHEPADFLALIARTNPKGIDLLSSGGGGGSAAPILTSQDIGGALGRCKHPVAASLLRVKYGGQDTAQLYRLWLAETRRIAAEQGWEAKARDAATFARLAFATLEAYLDPWCKNRRCQRRGTVRSRAGQSVAETREGRYVMVPCKSCEGTRIAKLSIAEKARSLNLTANGFKFAWTERWDFLAAHLEQVEHDAMMQFGHAIRQRD